MGSGHSTNVIITIVSLANSHGPVIPTLTLDSNVTKVSRVLSVIYKGDFNGR